MALFVARKRFKISSRRLSQADGFLFSKQKTLMFVHFNDRLFFFCSKNNPTPNQITKSESRQGIDSYLNISDYMKFDIFYL